MSDERQRCGTPCLKHAHACDRSPRHTGWHRDVQQKGDHACEWDTPGPKDFPAVMTALRSARAEGERLRAKLDQPCGSCHPCVNYADETWRAAGRKPPHVHIWDETRALVERLRFLAFEGGSNGEAARRAIIKAFVAHDAAMNGEGEFTPTTAEAERDRLGEQVQRVENGVRGFFADADVEGYDLNAMTVEELTTAVMAAIRVRGRDA